ncbi:MULTISPECIES: hypothetical protein [Campylobacter]|uniref:Uncharacterized protein n=1 Tax=Campylobacter jejuni TaxID=197 RepID=A0A5Z1S372_CAMJU|nr:MULTISPECIES: hypothetical protein [Campylobacter]ALW61640.1 hypothetical protein RC17_02505 [Campylobacter jejuni]EAH4777060.1 hypothetical protein [Campylobacter coli]EAH4888583.1 hypothetical protein [Campylobacter jejuni]EAH5074875.1 hypothetical protein [Campylobacter coli]EAH6244702.1 hypothetical protein [Campylobacter jejuni]
MTEIQFNEIKERLTQWRQERHLTYENQQAGFLGNVFEKVSEYFRAKNDLEKIDAICDIVIYFFNAFDFKYIAVSSNMYCYTFSDVVVYNIYSLFGARTDNLCVVENENDFINLEKNLNLTMFEIEQLCKNLGFDFYKCMLEKIKEIESRTGFYDERLKKFVDTICAFSKDEALSNVSKDFGFLGNSIIYKLTQEDKNFWFITCKEIETNLQIDYKVKKIYKADYKSCRL